jgi:hypothetical protein
MTKAQEKDRDEARAELRARLKPGQEILCVLRSVSRSGMSRVIDLKVIEDGEMRGLGWTAARALGDKYDTKAEGIKVPGCGMDMGFHIVYSLSSVLWRDGFDCIGTGPAGRTEGRPCPSNDHSNRDPSHHHRDGGYALRSRWV